MKKTGIYVVEEIHEAPDGSKIIRDVFVSQDKHEETREALAEDGSPGMGFEVLTCVEISEPVLPFYQNFHVGSLVSSRYKGDTSWRKTQLDRNAGRKTLAEWNAVKEAESNNAGIK